MAAKYIKKGQTPEGTARRLRAHHHNSLLGFACMMERHAIAIENSDTTTPETKALAGQIGSLVRELKSELKTRKD